MENRILSQIEHVVVVMLENRSLDNLLGWLYDENAHLNFVPTSNTRPYDGLVEGRYSNPFRAHEWDSIKYYPVVKGTGDDGFTVPNWDPNEDFPNVMAQIFGDAKHQPKTPPANGTIPKMQGFLQNFDSHFETWDQFLQIMKTYDNTEHGALIINKLAEAGAVSDRWYSSLPSQTNPNRAFSICGTSLGRTSNQHLTAIEQFNVKTIWNALHDRKEGAVNWALYYHDIWQNKKCYTEYTFPMIESAKGPRDIIAPIGKANPLHPERATGFFKQAMEGNLPAFTYIEPKWGYGINYTTSVQGNDYHPPTSIIPGEKLIAEIFYALRSNTEKWSKTLFVITFDEHGGTYDHHSPQWGAVDPKVPGSIRSDFNWNLFGVRIPTILISPYIKRNTVFRSSTGVPYDHTSLIATLLKWKGIDPTTAGMGDRVKVAPTFEDVLSDTLQDHWSELEIPTLPPDPESHPELVKIVEGLPTAIARCLTERSKSLEELQGRVDNYKKTGALPGDA